MVEREAITERAERIESAELVGVEREDAGWPTSKIRLSLKPVFSSMNSTSSGKNSGSSRVLTEMLQNTPLMRELEPEPPQRLHALHQQHIVDQRHHARALGHLEIGPGQDQLVGLGPDAGERLEIARPPVGERHGGLQIKVDPAGLDRLADDLEHLIVVDAGRDDGLDELLLDRRVFVSARTSCLGDDERSPLSLGALGGGGLLRAGDDLRLLEFVCESRPRTRSSAPRRRPRRQARSSRSRPGCAAPALARHHAAAGASAVARDQFAGQLLDQAFQHPEVAGDLLALVLASPSRSARTASILACTSSNSWRTWSNRPRPPIGAVAPYSLMRLVETLDAVGKQIEPGDVVLDPVDALQVLVDDFERRLDLVQPVGGRSGPGAAREHQIRGRHHHDRARRRRSARGSGRCRNGR